MIRIRWGWIWKDLDSDDDDANEHKAAEWWWYHTYCQEQLNDAYMDRPGCSV
jgi:hypothetical protein